MQKFAVDFYSGYLEEVLAAIGSRDITLVERFRRLGDLTKMGLGLPDAFMKGWEPNIEALLMDPPDELPTLHHAVAFASILKDAGQRRFRDFSDGPEPRFVFEVFDYLGKLEWAKDLLDSPVGQFRAPSVKLRWGFLDVTQTEELLTIIFGDDSFKKSSTAAIAGRLSTHPRQEAEKELLEVGIETQNSVSHNIDYLIIGSKGTGGTKHDKVAKLQKKGHEIKVLDEDGFMKLIRSPKPPKKGWSEDLCLFYENFVSALRHVWAFELDLYCLSYEYDIANNMI